MISSVTELPRAGLHRGRLPHPSQGADRGIAGHRARLPPGNIYT